ncbi:MAG: winged helix-turn-helix domain-containing protein, partial [Bacteroidia bacterium]
MPIRNTLISIFLFVALLLSFSEGYARQDSNDQHIEVAMRMIGHRVLLSSGDSTSVVLPVEQDSNQYRIRFGADIQFDPGALVSIVDDVFQNASIADHYIVEMLECGSYKVAYSYEVKDSLNNGMLPCRGRIPEKACYSLLITKLDDKKPAITSSVATSGSNSQDGSLTMLLIFSLFPVIGLLGYLWKKQQKPKIDPHIVAIGAYQLDTRSMELAHKKQVVELSGKEADLLMLLHTHANNTVEREVMLRNVWGDQGDYIGRTLDVFISKLRKRLEDDPNLKIVNI